MDDQPSGPLNSDSFEFSVDAYSLLKNMLAGEMPTRVDKKACYDNLSE